MSAFAKRRKLNNGTSTGAEKPPSSTEVTPRASPKPLKNDSNLLKNPSSGSAKRHDRGEAKYVATLEESSADDNSFAALTKASAVEFSGTREVDILNAKSLKVRISEGQKCSITGVAELWVREGLVSVYGAILRESAQSYMLYAPSSHAVPSITALSKSAEIQLEAVHNVQPYFDEDKRNPWLLSVAEGLSVTSFTLVGSTDVQIHESVKRLPELDLSDLNSLLNSNEPVRASAKISGHRPLSASRPRIMLCGRRSRTMSTYTIATINRLLTMVNSKGHPQHPNGVLLLDFDTLASDFAPPNTLSLVHIKTLTLGPSFCHPLTPNARINTIKYARYIDAEISDIASAKVFSDICDLVRWNPELRNLPLVIKGDEVLDSYWLNQTASWWDDLQPTRVILLDSTSNTPIVHSAQALAEKASCPFRIVTATFSRAISQEAESQLYLQSYFHILDYVTNNPVWSKSPVLCGGQNKVVLNYKENDRQLDFIMLNGGYLDPEDLVDALEQNMVFITAYSPTPEEIDDTRTSFSNVMSEEVSMDQTATHGIQALLTRDTNRFKLSCLGLGIVAYVDEEKEYLSLITPVPEDVLKTTLQQGARLGLLLSKPGADGRLSIEWAFRETDT